MEMILRLAISGVVISTNDVTNGGDYPLEWVRSRYEGPQAFSLNRNLSGLAPSTFRLYWPIRFSRCEDR